MCASEFFTDRVQFGWVWFVMKHHGLLQATNRLTLLLANFILGDVGKLGRQQIPLAVLAKQRSGHFFACVSCPSWFVHRVSRDEIHDRQREYMRAGSPRGMEIEIIFVMNGLTKFLHETEYVKQDWVLRGRCECVERKDKRHLKRNFEFRVKKN